MQIKNVAIIGTPNSNEIISSLKQSGATLIFIVAPQCETDANMQEIKKLCDTHNIKCLSLNNNLINLKDIDWIIDDSGNDIQQKLLLYSNIETVLKQQTIISINSALISLKSLANNLSNTITNRLMVANFSLNIVETVINNNEFSKHALTFIQNNMNKILVNCSDIPGLISKRLMYFFILTAINSTVKLHLNIEDVDSIMKNFIGKNGIYEFIDNIGLDNFIMELNLLQFQSPVESWLSKISPTLHKMVNDGYIGTKGLGGFYRFYDVAGIQVKQVIDLNTEFFRTAQISNFENKTINDLLTVVNASDKLNRFICDVWTQTIDYALSNIAPNNPPQEIDLIMKNMWNWNYGPFEIKDILNKFQSKK